MQLHMPLGDQHIHPTHPSYRNSNLPPSLPMSPWQDGPQILAMFLIQFPCHFWSEVAPGSPGAVYGAVVVVVVVVVPRFVG